MGRSGSDLATCNTVGVDKLYTFYSPASPIWRIRSDLFPVSLDCLLILFFYLSSGNSVVYPLLSLTAFNYSRKRVKYQSWPGTALCSTEGAETDKHTLSLNNLPWPPSTFPVHGNLSHFVLKPTCNPRWSVDMRVYHGPDPILYFSQVVNQNENFIVVNSWLPDFSFIPTAQWHLTCFFVLRFKKEKKNLIL